ncbi:K02A2.6-like [Cordylochernes scorpioides]|uniref:K02A2.6-like n=1 Tax=Cordylochernes scorpioides TaxID=51811 RepID=A0ABY6K541_9ARAC|nr:K02A2.6-like [Cordylochernes scorpioides]
MEDDHRPTVNGSYLPCQRQRDPSTFSGDGNINPGQWLKEYERVSKYNRWDETMKLANVIFYLNGTAGRWFDNNEESLNSWRSFEDALTHSAEDSARRAEEVLKSRAQKAEESSESYIQEILSLCHQVNPRIEEGEIVAHIIKEISEDTYQVLVAKDIQTVDEILKFCRHLTTIKQRRIGRTKFARLSNVMPISCVDDSDDLAGLIRRIVREEIQKVFSAPEVINPLREVNALEQTVREEVSRALQPTRPQVNVVQQQPRTPYYNIDRPTQPRKTEHWRTYDDKPICFHCGRPGHVVRYCRERRQVFAEARTRNGGEGRNVGFSSRPPRYDADDDYFFPTSKPRKVASPKTIPVASPSFQPFSQASECGKLSGAASNGGEVAIEENPPGYIAAKLKENFVMVEINGRKIKALVDSGADFSVISDKFRRELKTPLFKEPGPILKAANKNLIKTIGKCVLNIEVNGLNISFEFVVMVECSHDIIFGWDFFKATEAVIDCGRNELHLGETSVLESREEENQRLFASDDFVIPPKSIKKISVINEEICGVRDVLVSTSKDLLLRKEVLIPNSLVTFRHGRGSIWVANGASWPQLIPSGMNMCTMESYDNGNICSLIESSDELQETQLKSREWSQKINLTLDPGLSEIQRLQLVSCLDEFIDIFDFGSTPIKPTSTVKHKINTGDHSPIKQRPYRVAPSERRLIQDEENKMIENHIVKPSESPWSSPVILVRKKVGTWRFCVDYRRLNKITKKDVYPLPCIDDALDSLAGSSYFSTMDLRSGYWQIEVDEKDREKTVFITPDRLYEFRVMPFGLCNAPATFERMIDSVLRSIKWNMCLCYLDDIVVYAPTFEEHIRRLQLVLKCIQKAGLSLNHKKCLFGSRRINILGHLVDANGIHPDPGKVEAVSKFPRPKNISELRSFLGLCSYYRRFIENLADKAKSLHDLLKTEKQFYWYAAQEKAFEVLKTALISEPVLGHFDESADTHLHTDASGHGIGAVLLQIQGGKERPIAYASRSLTKAEHNYSTTEKECLAVVWSISKFRPYLFGRPFTVVTDHHSLCWLPFYKLGVDLLGRFPVSKDGNRWIIVCTDYMTRYAITKAIPDGGAIETAKFLVEDVILKHGAPREMITDRGRNFISQVIKEIIALCGIVHIFTTAYHPQTNGLTERFNKTLGDTLSMYTGVEQKDWDQVLPYVTFAYNTAKQEATGYTPFFLVHAREAETYIDAVLPYLPDEISDDYVGELVTRAEEARQLSRSRLLQSQAKDRRLYDQKHTPVYYQKDDLVWVFTPIRKVGLSEKLLKRYFGPYKVTKKLSEVTYEVEPVDPSPRSRKSKDIVHVIRMKPYLDPEEQHSILLGNTGRDRFTSRTRAETSDAKLKE